MYLVYLIRAAFSVTPIGSGPGKWHVISHLNSDSIRKRSPSSQRRSLWASDGSSLGTSTIQASRDLRFEKWVAIIGDAIISKLISDKSGLLRRVIRRW